MVNVNASDHEYAYQSFKKLCKDKVLWIINFVTIIIVLVCVYTPLNHLLKLDPLTAAELGIALVLSVVSVFWVELVKLIKNIYRKNN